MLGLLGDLRQVVEKDQGVCLPVTLQGNKAGLQQWARRRGLQTFRTQRRIDQLLLQAADQLRGEGVEDFSHQLVLADQAQGALVGL